MTRPPTTDHLAEGRIDLAARWLAETPREAISGSVLHELQTRFGLRPAEAVAAIREAQCLRTRGAAL
jgi:hypothetical protein